jgi:O-antigen/teichoic acid export membrane protein
LSHWLQVWQQDGLLRKIVRNSAYLFSSNTLSMGLNVVQSVFAARLLGAAGFGLLGTVTVFVSSVDRLFSFRMGELVVKYAGQYLAQGRKDHAAAIVKAAALAEAASALLAFFLVLALAPLAAVFFAKDAGAAAFFAFYALILLANLFTETATALLQVGGHFRSQAIANLGQALLTAGLILYAFFTGGGLWTVLAAYMLGKIALGLALTGLGLWRAGSLLGPGWWRASFRLLPPGRELWRFALSSNLSGTVNLVTRDSEVLWVAYFLSPLQAGYYKVALAVINLILMPINPFINTTFPEIARTVAQKDWDPLRSLLKRLSTLAGAWTGLVALVLFLAGEWLITTFYGAEYGPAAPAALILLAGFGTANVLYWNRALLLSLGEPTYLLKVTALAGLAKIALGFLLVPRYGYLAQAALLSGFFVLSISLIVWRGLRQIRAQSVEAGP